MLLLAAFETGRVVAAVVRVLADAIGLWPSARSGSEPTTG